VHLATYTEEKQTWYYMYYKDCMTINHTNKSINWEKKLYNTVRFTDLHMIMTDGRFTHVLIYVCIYTCIHCIVYVMYQNISEWSTIDYLIAYKVLPLPITSVSTTNAHPGLRPRGHCYSLPVQITSVLCNFCKRSFPRCRFRFLWFTVFPIAVSAIVLALLTFTFVICCSK